MQDTPDYVIKPSVMKALLSNIIITTVLCFVFYIGIAINVSLLNIRMPDNIRWLIIAVLALLIIIQALLSYIQTSKTTYSIFKNRIQIDSGKTEYIMFNSVQELKHKKSIFDNLFGTGTIVIDKKKLSGIPNFEQTFAYIQQMMQYSRTQYNQMS